MTDTATVANALTSAMNAFGFQGSQASNIMDVMNATVSSGKMEWAQYATVVGLLSNAAKGSGFSFMEANAALATMTDSGMSAQRASTYLQNTMGVLGLKTDAMAAHAKSLGITFDENKFKSMDLAGKMSYLTQITGGNNAEVLKLLGNNSVADKTYLLLTGHMSTYTGILATLNDQYKNGGATAKAWEITQGGFNVTMDRAHAAVQVLLIVIGTYLLPVLTGLVPGGHPDHQRLYQLVDSGPRAL